MRFQKFLPIAVVLFGTVLSHAQTELIVLEGDLPESLVISDSEAQRTQEKLEIAAAKVRAYSSKVTVVQNQVNSVHTELIANRALLEQEQEKRHVRGIGPRANAEESGRVAGLAFLYKKVNDLQAKQDELIETFVSTIRTETWNSLAPEMKRLVIIHKLMTGFQESDITADKGKSAAVVAWGSTKNWTPVKLEDIKHRITFPAKPELVTTKKGPDYVLKHDDVTYRLYRYADLGIPANITAEVFLKFQAEAAVKQGNQNSRPSANAGIMLAGQSAQEYYTFYKDAGEEYVDRTQIVLLNNELICLDVLHAKHRDDNQQQRSEAFFASFQPIDN